MASVKPLMAADRDGAAAFTWTVPAALPTGDYYLKVQTGTRRSMSSFYRSLAILPLSHPFSRPAHIHTQATDLLGRGFGLSPAFAVDTQRRRRLFGPSHEFYD